MAKREQKQKRKYLIDFEKLEDEGFSTEFLLIEKLKSVGIKVKGSENLDQILTLCSKLKKTT